MLYITYEDMCRDIRNNLTKIPRDVDGVIGMPRSGMLPATIIAEYLNVGLTTPDTIMSSETVEDAIGEHGHRRMNNPGRRRLLVVDDTCFHGHTLKETKARLNGHWRLTGYELIYLVVYLEGPCDATSPDIYLRDVRNEAKGGPFNWALYEWNIFAHGRLTERTLFDLDGVFCKEPPDERDTEAYLEYIKNPVPLYIPTGKDISVCTYRLEKYQNETSEFLSSVGLADATLYMFPAKTWQERHDSGITPWEYKARVYRDGYWMLFIESSDNQARKIHDLTGKPVYCVETNKIYD